MKLIDILIFLLSVAGLVYFMFERIKYSNRERYYEKSERLKELERIIAVIENENGETEEIIKSINADTVYDDEMTDRLINYRDNEGYLKDLKKEQREIELYLRIARKSFDSLGV
jgi:hypothetical protein